MTVGRDFPAPSVHTSSDEDAAEGALRRMMHLTDDIITGLRPLDSLCTFTMLLARHEFVLHLARLTDKHNRIRRYSRAKTMSRVKFTAEETCEYISEMATELKRLADAAGVSQISALLTQVVEQAEKCSRRPDKQPIGERDSDDGHA